MTKRMLIDATHEEETRVAITDGNKLVEYDYESRSRKPIKGNIYLAKVTRVEPSLQAAFVNFGGNRHGFLPFSEIHPDYFRIPIADREALLAEQEAMLAEQEAQLEKEAAEDAAAAAAAGEDIGIVSQISEEGDESEESEGEDDYIEETGGAVASLDDADNGDDVPLPEIIPLNELIDLSPEGLDEGAEEGEFSAEESDEQGTEGEENGEGEAQENGNGENGEKGEGRPRNGRGRRGRRGRDGRRSNFRNRSVELVGGEEVEEDSSNRFRFNLRRKYKIQEVIKRGQIMLVQANKEERGNKGAAVGTYLSLPGRYCVLMPNSPRAGGVSRKIANYKDRARMREIMRELEVPKGMSVIVRTAGVSRTKVEIKRDLDYLMRLWDSIRELTLQSSAPAMVYEEADLIKRSIRDLYTRDVEDILVAGETGFKNAKNFMKMMVPSHIKKVQMYEDPQLPLFNRYQIETQIHEIGQPQVRLRSGGYLVINPTEALVSIDVNSGKATKERHIEETALKTNLEAAEEVARQLKLRDLGGLIVIDFIDMEDRRNNARVERRLKEALSSDRARVQVGRISSFGLLELSRQRLSPSLTESQYEVCTNCKGMGLIRTSEAMSILVLRAIEEEGIRARASQITVHVCNAVALYILNNKRKSLADIESRYNFEVLLRVDDEIPASDYRLEITKAIEGAELPLEETPSEVRVESSEDGENSQRRDRNRGRRGGRNRNRGDRQDREDRRPREEFKSDNDEFSEEDDNIGNQKIAEDDDSFDEQPPFKPREEGDSQNRRRRRRGGRNRNRNRGDRPQNENGNEPNGNTRTERSERPKAETKPKQEPKPERVSSNDDFVAPKPASVQEVAALPKAEVRQPRKEPQSSASYEVVSDAPKDSKKRGWWNRLTD